ncbi:MAG: Rsd/AlgQ family anti-sigma factor [Gammaproteobacteria bacterium]|nr:Rsd/AlgQ family anti-sigma factor [Gammaproteobacteria bacterium]
MTKNIKDERRGRSAELIENMLKERKQLLALLFQITDLGSHELEDSDREVFDEFCQVLVDYIAAGHFGLYARISEGTERRKSVADLAVKIYPKIEQTTEAALAFNERFDPNKTEEMDFSGIEQILSSLAESITTRIELEDQLISRMLERTATAEA